MKCSRLITAVLAISLSTAVTACGKPAGKVFSRDRHLLLDSRIVESTENAQLTVGAVRKDKSNPLFKEDRPWHRDSVSHWFQSYRDALGLPKHYSLHSLRHSFINTLIEKGIPREIVHKLVGHSSERTTADHYDHTLALHFREQAELVNLEESS